MTTLSRAFRIAIGWTLVWMTFWMAVIVVIGILDPDSIDPGEGPIAAMTIFGPMGLLSGFTFGMFLPPTRHTLSVAGWGYLGSAIAQVPYLGHGDSGLVANILMALLFSAGGSLVSIVWLMMTRGWARWRQPIVTMGVLAAAISLGSSAAPIVRAQHAADVPAFAVDATWPKPLPNNWAVGPVSGVAVDARDHVWIIHRREGVKETGRVAAPPVIEFDAAGNVVQTWGGAGAGYEWPQQVHGITIDGRDRVWISGNGETDGQILAFTRTGQFLRQIGRSGKPGGNDDTKNLARATQMRVDTRANEVFVSDGEQNQHHRVIVFDSETGAYKRHWGAYGEKPGDAAPTAPVDPGGPPSKQFGTAVHCVRFDRDGLVYVCDRSNSRIQIFRKDGRFVKEAFVAKETRSAGSVYDLEFSPDQRFVYVADGANQKMWILRRDDLRVAGSVGERGAGPGQFATSLHDLAVDSKGNVYTGEAAAGGRVQKFLRR